VFKQGDAGDGMYILSSGVAKVIKKDVADDQPREVMTLQQNMYFGERALLNNEPRAASVRAATDIRTSFISRRVFERKLGSLQTLLDANRKKRERAVLKQRRLLDKLAMADVTRSSFRFEAQVTVLPCGALFLATHVITGDQYTLRQEAKALVVEEGEEDRVAREVEILHSLTVVDSLSRTLPTKLRCFQTADSLFMLYKGKAVCELSKLIENGKPLTEDELRFVGACVVQATHTLHHECQVLYRNYLPENIHVQDNGYVTLMDLRLATKDDGNCRTLCGAPAYFAPEMVLGQLQTFATDWWGVGVMMFELSDGGGLPWGGDVDDDITIINRITSHKLGGVRAPRGAVLSGIEHLTEMINQLIDPDRETRLGSNSGTELMEHPFFRSVDFEKLIDSDLPSPLYEYAQTQLMFRMEQVAEADEFQAPSFSYANDEAYDDEWCAEYC